MKYQDITLAGGSLKLLSPMQAMNQPPKRKVVDNNNKCSGDVEMTFALK